VKGACRPLPIWGKRRERFEDAPNNRRDASQTRQDENKREGIQLGIQRENPNGSGGVNIFILTGLTA